MIHYPVWKDDSLPSEKKLCNVQASIEELGDNKKETVTDGEVFCDAQCGFIESVNNETDPVSDEEEFWDAQSSFKGYDDSTYDLNINEESSIKILSDKAVDDEERYFNMEGDFNVNEDNTELHSEITTEDRKYITHSTEDEEKVENPSPDSEQCYSLSGNPESGDRKRCI